MNQKCNTDKSEWIWLTNRKWPKFAPCRKLYPSRHSCSFLITISERISIYFKKYHYPIHYQIDYYIFNLGHSEKKKILPSHRNICIENHHSFSNLVSPNYNINLKLPYILLLFFFLDNLICTEIALYL